MPTGLAPLGVTAPITANTSPVMGMVNRYDATAGNRAPTLPALSGLNVNAIAVIQKFDSSANTVTATRSGTDTFDDGSTAFVLVNPGDMQPLQVVLYSGTKYWKKMGGGTGSGALGSDPTLNSVRATNGTTMLSFNPQTSAINNLLFTNRPTGFGPIVGVFGTDTNISLFLQPKGTGNITHIAGSATAVYKADGTATDVGLDLQTKGAGIVSANSVPVITTTGVQTISNKRVTRRAATTTSSATPAINTDNVDIFGLTAQSVNVTSFTTNLTGTATEGQLLWIYVVGTASRTLSWGTAFESSTVPLPTTTSGTDRLDIGLVWNTATSKWRCIAQG